jgi:hypothetical protein
MGAAHVFRGAGFVLRCSHCHNTLVTVVRSEARMWIGFAGMRTLEVAVP